MINWTSTTRPFHGQQWLVFVLACLLHRQYRPTTIGVRSFARVRRPRAPGRLRAHFALRRSDAAGVNGVTLFEFYEFFYLNSHPPIRQRRIARAHGCFWRASALFPVDDHGCVAVVARKFWDAFSRGGYSRCRIRRREPESAHDQDDQEHHAHDQDGHEQDGHEQDGHEQDGHDQDGHEQDSHEQHHGPISSPLLVAAKILAASTFVYTPNKPVAGIGSGTPDSSSAGLGST